MPPHEARVLEEAVDAQEPARLKEPEHQEHDAVDHADVHERVVPGLVGDGPHRDREEQHHEHAAGGAEAGEHPEEKGDPDSELPVDDEVLDRPIPGKAVKEARERTSGHGGPAQEPRGRHFSAELSEDLLPPAPEKEESKRESTRQDRPGLALFPFIAEEELRDAPPSAHRWKGFHRHRPRSIERPTLNIPWRCTVRADKRGIY